MLFTTRALGVILAALVSVGCGYHAPAAPTPTITPIADTAPYALSLNVVVGLGANAGRSTVIARVSNVRNAALPGVAVTFASDVGTIAPAAVITDGDGLAATTITGIGAATVTAGVGTLTASTLVALQPIAAPPPATDPTLPPAPAPVPPPPPPSPPPSTGTPPELLPLTVTISVNPAVAGQATTFGLATSAVTSATWTFGDGLGATTTGGGTSHVYTSAGTYTVSVTVTDAQGRTASDTETVVIAAPPPPPPPPPPSYTVALSASPSTVIAGNSSTLTATVTQQNGAPAPTSFAWDCNGDGIAETTTGVNTATCTYPSAGSIPSRVTVTGGTVTGSASTTVTVAVGAPLFVNITASKSTLAVGENVVYVGTVTSSGSVPSTLQWEWDFENTATSPYTRTEPGPSPHATVFEGYGSTGVKTIKVRVTDTVTGRTATGTRTVTVQ